MPRSLHVVILNIDFPPDTSDTARVVQDMANVLAARHRVTVVAGRPFYDPTERHPYYLFKKERAESLTVLRVGSTAFTRRRMGGRLTNYLTYLLLALPQAIALKPDVVVAMTSPPLAGLAGALVAAVWRRPFIYNIRDLHPDMALAAGVVRPGLFTKVWDWLHRWVLRHSHEIVVLGDDMRDRITAKGIPADRVTVIRNGAPPAAGQVSRGHPVIETLRRGFSTLALHGGNLGYGGAWDSILGAAALVQNDGIGVVFIGDGAARAAIQRRSEEIVNVRVLPFRPQEEIPYVLEAPDIHIVTVKRGLEGLLVPGKLYPILAAGRPVLAIADRKSDVVRIVSRFNCGLVADPDDPDQIASALRWASTHQDELRDMGRQALLASHQFDRTTLLERFADLVDRAGGFPARRY